MHGYSQQEYRNRQRYCALVVLVAVCALTISVATRYNRPEDVGIAVVTNVHPVVSPTPSRQRLIGTPAAWHPPADKVAFLDTTSFYPRLAPAAPPIPSLLFGESLYYRPPPVVSLS